jgi:hypothetical protein
MHWPYRFPHPADVIAEEAEEFQRAPPAERVRRLGELADLAVRMATDSPYRADIEAATEASEAQWRAAHHWVFRHFGPRFDV